MPYLVEVSSTTSLCHFNLNKFASKKPKKNISPSLVPAVSLVLIRNKPSSGHYHRRAKLFEDRCPLVAKSAHQALVVKSEHQALVVKSERS
jgi:hypothetical protein